MWFKTEGKFAFHQKVILAGNKAIGLWVRAGAWSADALTDGHIPSAVISALGGTQADARKLVSVGLWTKTSSGYQFHDWEDYQPSASDQKALIEEGHRRRQERARKAAQARWAKESQGSSPDQAPDEPPF